MIYIALLILGLGLGSFVNALVWRIRQQLDDDGEPKKLSKAKQKQLSIMTGRSMCPHCKHQLAATDLIPVFSWLWLRGRCRYCRQQISAQYPLIELLVALLFVSSYVFWPVAIESVWQVVLFANWLIALTGLVALAIYDIRWMLLPDKILYPISIIAIIATALSFVLGRPTNEMVAVCVSVFIGGGIFAALFFLSKGKWIGFGDVKLGLYLGLLLSIPSLAMLMLFLASLLGMAVTIPLLLGKKVNKQTRIPFGPFLIAASILAMLFGSYFVNWYSGLFLV